MAEGVAGVAPGGDGGADEEGFWRKVLSLLWPKLPVPKMKFIMLTVFVMVIVLVNVIVPSPPSPRPAAPHRPAAHVDACCPSWA